MATHLSPISDDIYEVVGELTFHSINNQLRKLPKRLLSSVSQPQIMLNKVQHIDSAGLALLIDWSQQSLRNQSIVFTKANEQLLGLITLYNLDAVLPLQRSLESSP
jgi:anti-anti-sigma factor